MCNNIFTANFLYHVYVDKLLDMFLHFQFQFRGQLKNTTCDYSLPIRGLVQILTVLLENPAASVCCPGVAL